MQADHLTPSTGSGAVRVMTGLDAALSRIETAMLGLSLALIAVIMLLVSADAGARYLFNQPLQFTFDLVTMYMLPGAMYFALSYTLRKGGHINVDLISSMLPPRVANLALGLCYLLAAGLIAVVIWRVSVLTHEGWAMGEATVGLYAWPTWLSTAIVPAAFSILLLRILHLAAAHLASIVIRHPALEAIIAPSRDIREEEAL